MQLIDKVEHILEKNDYDYSEYSGCFDIAARKREMLLLKVLDNIDSFQGEQSNNLKILSSHLEASPFLIGTHTRRENLVNNIIYERFGIFAMTTETLENIITNEMPMLYRNKGGLFAEINPEKLRNARTTAGFSQSQLARKLGISKKSIYEHESRKMRAEYEIIKKMEQLIGNVTDPVSMEASEAQVKSVPKEGFQKIVSRDMRRMGFETRFVSQSPFNIIADSENFLIMSDAEELAQKVERNAPFLRGFANATKKPILAVTKDELDIDIPSIAEHELRELETMGELRRFLKRW